MGAMDYTRTAKTVKKAFAKYGQDVILRKLAYSAGVYNPATQEVVTSAPAHTDETLQALVTDQPGTRIGPQYGNNVERGTLVHSAERWLYVDATGSEPQPKDQMIVQGVTYTVADVQSVGPAGVPVFYLVVLRA